MDEKTKAHKSDMASPRLHGFMVSGRNERQNQRAWFQCPGAEPARLECNVQKYVARQALRRANPKVGLREKDFNETPHGKSPAQHHYYVIQLSSSTSSARSSIWVSAHFGQSTCYDHIKLHLTETQQLWLHWIEVHSSHVTGSPELHSCHFDLETYLMASSCLPGHRPESVAFILSLERWRLRSPMPSPL